MRPSSSINTVIPTFGGYAAYARPIAELELQALGPTVGQDQGFVAALRGRPAAMAHAPIRAALDQLHEGATLGQLLANATEEDLRALETLHREGAVRLDRVTFSTTYTREGSAIEYLVDHHMQPSFGSTARFGSANDTAQRLSLPEKMQRLHALGVPIMRDTSRAPMLVRGALSLPGEQARQVLVLIGEAVLAGQNASQVMRDIVGDALDGQRSAEARHILLWYIPHAPRGIDVGLCMEAALRLDDAELLQDVEEHVDAQSLNGVFKTFDRAVWSGENNARFIARQRSFAAAQLDLALARNDRLAATFVASSLLRHRDDDVTQALLFNSLKQAIQRVKLPIVQALTRSWLAADGSSRILKITTGGSQDSLDRLLNTARLASVAGDSDICRQLLSYCRQVGLQRSAVHQGDETEMVPTVPIIEQTEIDQALREIVRRERRLQIVTPAMRKVMGWSAGLAVTIGAGVGVFGGLSSNVERTTRTPYRDAEGAIQYRTSTYKLPLRESFYNLVHTDIFRDANIAGCATGAALAGTALIANKLDEPRRRDERVFNAQLQHALEDIIQRNVPPRYGAEDMV